MTKSLTVHADLWSLCDQVKEYSGSYPLMDLPRLKQLLATVQGEAVFTLRFDRDAARRGRVKGHIEAQLGLECQRCLNDLALVLSFDFQLGLVSGAAEIACLPDDYEPMMIEDGAVVELKDLIEDELLLALPQTPRHQDKGCKLVMPSPLSADWLETASEVNDNPFAQLAELKEALSKKQ